MFYEEEESEDDALSIISNESGKTKKPLPPLFMYAVFEALQTPQGKCVLNFLCYIRDDEAECHILLGENGALDFLEELDAMTESPDDDGEQSVIIVFHNLKGFDEIFILQELYKQQREVTHQLTVGAKVLSFQSPVKFIDSLLFLPMPLSAFSSMFRITEHKKVSFYMYSTAPITNITVGNGQL